MNRRSLYRNIIIFFLQQGSMFDIGSSFSAAHHAIGICIAYVSFLDFFVLGHICTNIRSIDRERVPHEYARTKGGNDPPHHLFRLTDFSFYGVLVQRLQQIVQLGFPIQTPVVGISQDTLRDFVAQNRGNFAIVAPFLRGESEHRRQLRVRDFVLGHGFSSLGSNVKINGKVLFVDCPSNRGLGENIRFPDHCIQQRVFDPRHKTTGWVREGVGIHL
mmetsp:Transcript_33804/g.79671  ORF Transcript_33804/g.79671 Transcript_33804/m.79671 type:complete len:217 (+) Transcript_33804:48-698(+)